jgi:cytochrome b561
MPLLNTPAGYGALTKACHWIVAALFALQLASGPVMVRIGETATVAGLGQNDLYNWHKTLGLVALAVVLVRIWARRAGTLPDWAPVLSEGERRAVHQAERALYLAMVAMPVSGFVYVMAGGYGVLLAGLWPLPNPIGRWEALALGAKWLHVGGAVLLAAALALHLGIVLRHALLLRDGLLRRMLPGRPAA